jgi:prepilin-type N-terminal cleavage/methylation domain-containing protein
MKKKLKGFTLIELLVSAGIMAVVVGIGLTRIGVFGDEKQVLEEANKLAADLRWARAGAQNGLHADQCVLDAEYGGIKVTVGANSYTMTVQCTEGSSWTKNFSSGVTASGAGNGNVIFEPVDQGIDANQDFILSKGGVSYGVSVKGEGSIKIIEL